MSASAAQYEAKRPRLDPDGFVKPTAPDIPKSSIYYTSATDDTDDGCQGSYEPETPSVSYGESGELAYGVSEEKEIGEAGTLGDGGQSQETESYSVKISAPGAGVLQIETALKDLGHQLKSFIGTWAQSFGESESYEAAGVERIEQLLTQARELEAGLNEQKTQLLNRLKHLSSTLQPEG